MQDSHFWSTVIGSGVLLTIGWWVAMLEMGPLLWTYPLIKRFSWWPQAWLGFAVNIGFSLAWFQVDAALAPKAVTGDMVDLSFARALDELRDSMARSPQMPLVNLLMVLGTSWCVRFSRICATYHLRLLTSQLDDGL